MARGASGGSRNTVYGGVKSKSVLKKGPWTPSEDLILMEYVTKYGEGNWNAVQRNTGLERGGKSCRLRWANHLRPNLKKGAFSPEEEKLITELHAEFGNKWAKMATMVPGRTDNEIKNYWNTRLKRRLKAGLPIYAQLGEEEEIQQLNSSSPSSPPNLPSSNHRSPDYCLFFDSVASPQIQRNPPTYFNNGGHGVLFGTKHPLFPTSHLFNQNPLNPSPMGSLLQLSSHGYRADPDLEMEILGLPSIQLPRGAPPSDKNDGLLQDLLGKSRDSAWPEKTEEPFFPAAETMPGNPSFRFDEINKGYSAVDEDIMSLLDSFPMLVPIPVWDEGGTAADDLLFNPMATQERNLDSCIWNHMPTIY